MIPWLRLMLISKILFSTVFNINLGTKPQKTKILISCLFVLNVGC
jgi:hypothetical protein